MTKIKITKDNAVKACLALWKALSERPTHVVRENKKYKHRPESLKARTLEKLGYNSNIIHRCPLCEIYCNYSAQCEECPISKENPSAPFNVGCYKTPYSEWELKTNVGEYKHDQELARKFYDYLVELFK